MRQSEADEPGPYDLAFSHVEVDLEGLSDFQQLLRHELEANIRPTVGDINTEHGVGAQFGARIAGVDVQDARRRYHTALASSTQSLTGYIRTSEVLISAIDILTTRYQDTDLSSEVILNEIKRASYALPPLPDTAAVPGYVPPSVAHLGLRS